MRFLIYFLVSHTIPARDVVVSKNPLSLQNRSKFNFCTVFCVYWYESVLCRIFFSSLPNLRAWNQGQNQSDVPQGIIASPSQWDAANPQTNWQLHSWHSLFQPTSSTAQVRASGPAEPWKFHIHKGATSVLPPRSTGGKTAAPNLQGGDGRQDRISCDCSATSLNITLMWQLFRRGRHY